MQDENKSKTVKSIPDSDLQRQRMIDEGGTQKYGDRDKNKNKDDNILIDAEHWLIYHCKVCKKRRINFQIIECQIHEFSLQIKYCSRIKQVRYTVKMPLDPKGKKNNLNIHRSL